MRQLLKTVQQVRKFKGGYCELITITVVKTNNSSFSSTMRISLLPLGKEGEGDSSLRLLVAQRVFVSSSRNGRKILLYQITEW